MKKDIITQERNKTLFVNSARIFEEIREKLSKDVLL